MRAVDQGDENPGGGDIAPVADAVGDDPGLGLGTEEVLQLDEGVGGLLQRDVGLQADSHHHGAGVLRGGHLLLDVREEGKGSEEGGDEEGGKDGEDLQRIVEAPFQLPAVKLGEAGEKGVDRASEGILLLLVHEAGAPHGGEGDRLEQGDEDGTR